MGFFAIYPPGSGGGGSGGVTSLNGQTGALTLVAGTGITITPGAGTLTINATASAPTGDPNTVAFFNSAGNLDSNPDFTFSESLMSVSFGIKGTGGVISAPTQGSLAFGEALGAGSIISTDQIGSLVHGYALDGGEIEAGAAAQGAQAFGFARTASSIYAAAVGALAHGRAENAGSEIEASGEGSTAYGFADNAGALQASGTGALAHGSADGSNLTASGVGSHAHGSGGQTASGAGSHAHGTGAIIASASGSHAHGEGAVTASQRSSTAFGLNEGGSIESIGAGGGNLAFGKTSSGAIIRATAGGANDGGNLAHGAGTAGAGTIIASGSGTFAGGKVEANAPCGIEANGIGSIAHGYVGASNSNIISQHASIAVGESSNGFNLFAAPWSITVGSSEQQDNSAAGQWSQAFGNSNLVNSDLGSAFGLGHTNGSYASFILGRYGKTVGTAASWVASDPLFMLANGTSIGAEDYAFQVLKDGTLFIKDPSLGGASVGDVWTLQDASTGEGAWAPAASSGADTALSNLASTAVNVSIIPASNNAIDLGSAGLVWNDIYVTNARVGSFVLTPIVASAGGTNVLYTASGLGQPPVSTGSTASIALVSSDITNPMAVYTTNSSGANANPTGSLELATGNKTAGTGDSGTITIQTGSSSGGLRGEILLNADRINANSGVFRTFNSAADPTTVTALAGDIYFNTTLNKLKVYSGTAWETITSV